MTLKDLERAWRRLWIRALTALLGRRRGAGAPGWGRDAVRVLFLRHDRIGDMILSTGILRSIAASQPGLELHVLASTANAPILREEPYVREIVVFDRRRLASYPALVRRLRRARYDVVVDCMVTAPSLTTLLLMWASGAPHRVGVAGRGNDAAYTLLVETPAWARHITEHLAALVAAFGVEPAPEHARPSLQVTAGERARAEQLWQSPPGDRLLVNISAGTGNRRWPDERFRRAIAHARGLRPKLEVVVTSAPADAEGARAIAAAAGGRHVATAGIRDAIALVATGDFVLTPDTSIAHAASALGTAVISMHLAWSIERWGVLGTNAHDVASAGRTLESLQAEPVLRALDAMLERHPG